MRTNFPTLAILLLWTWYLPIAWSQTSAAVQDGQAGAQSAESPIAFTLCPGWINKCQGSFSVHWTGGKSDTASVSMTFSDGRPSLDYINIAQRIFTYRMDSDMDLNSGLTIYVNVKDPVSGAAATCGIKVQTCQINRAGAGDHNQVTMSGGITTTPSVTQDSPTTTTADPPPAVSASDPPTVTEPPGNPPVDSGAPATQAGPSEPAASPSLVIVDNAGTTTSVYVDASGATVLPPSPSAFSDSPFTSVFSNGVSVPSDIPTTASGIIESNKPSDTNVIPGSIPTTATILTKSSGVGVEENGTFRLLSTITVPAPTGAGSPPDSHHGVNMTMIGAIVGGVAAVLVIVGILVFRFIRRRRPPTKKEQLAVLEEGDVVDRGYLGSIIPLEVDKEDLVQARAPFDDGTWKHQREVPQYRVPPKARPRPAPIPVPRSIPDPISPPSSAPAPTAMSSYPRTPSQPVTVSTNTPFSPMRSAGTTSSQPLSPPVLHDVDAGRIVPVLLPPMYDSSWNDTPPAPATASATRQPRPW